MNNIRLAKELVKVAKALVASAKAELQQLINQKPSMGFKNVKSVDRDLNDPERPCYHITTNEGTRLHFEKLSDIKEKINGFNQKYYDDIDKQIDFIQGKIKSYNGKLNWLKSQRQNPPEAIDAEQVYNALEKDMKSSLKKYKDLTDEAADENGEELKDWKPVENIWKQNWDY